MGKPESELFCGLQAIRDDWGERDSCWIRLDE